GQAMAKFLIRRREIEITLDEGEPYELFPLVADGSLDVALGFKYDLVPPQFPDNLLLQSVTAEDLYVVASDKHRLVTKHAIDSVIWRTRPGSHTVTRPRPINVSVRSVECTDSLLVSPFGATTSAQFRALLLQVSA